MSWERPEDPPEGWIERLTVEGPALSVVVQYRNGGQEVVRQWLAEHECPGRAANSTIGGRLSFVVTATGIGTCVDAQCNACGAQLHDLTNLAENF